MLNSFSVSRSHRYATASHTLPLPKFWAKVFASLVLFCWVGSATAGDSVVVVILDDSGSMQQVMADAGRGRPRIEVAKNALQQVIGKLPDGTRFGVMLLNGAARQQGWLVPLAELNRKYALQQVASVDADGGTPLGQAMIVAMDQLLQLRTGQPYGDYRLLVVTDGEATDGWLLDQHLSEMVSRGVVVDVIGVDMQAAHSLSSKSHSYRRANDAASFERALSEIFAEESASSDGDAAQGNFDLISGLPDEFASELLTSWALLPNGPIGQTHSQSGDAPLAADQAAYQGGSSTIAPSGSYPQGPSTPSVEGSTNFRSIVFGLIVIVFFLVPFLKSLMSK